MDGLFFLSAIVGMVVIVLWYIRNDHVTADGRTDGLLAMPYESSPGTLPDDPASSRSGGRARTARRAGR